MEFVGILAETAWVSATHYTDYSQPHFALAGYAGNGFGLCTNYTDVQACDEEEKEMKEELVYTIIYTNTSLHVQLSHLGIAHLAYQPYDAAYTHKDVY
ncbi:MAG: hypothetical protein Q9181_007897 [Wetmoreana brouardii]